MTNRYVRSGAAGAADGTSWADAYLTQKAAVDASAAGDWIFVSEDHAESSGTNQIYGSPGTRAAPLYIICVDHLGSVPPVSADVRSTAQVTVTGASSIRFETAEHATISDGVNYHVSGSGHFFGGNADNTSLQLRNCTLRLGTSTGSRIYLASSVTTISGTRTEWDNVKLHFGSTFQSVVAVGSLLWKNTPAALPGSVPTNLFIGALDSGCFIDLRGVDLSAMGSGDTLFGSFASAVAVKATMLDCKLGASVAVSAGLPNRGALEVDMVRCSPDGVNYRQARHRYDGVLTEETTIVRTGGASNGTTPIAWKIVTNADAEWSFPFESPPIAIWNDVDGSSVTATVEGIWGGGAVPNDDEIWLEVEYLGDNASPQASFANDSKADILATGAAQTASAETWGGSTTDFKLEVTFTPQQPGWIFARVKCAKPSETFYIDPKVTLS